MRKNYLFLLFVLFSSIASAQTLSGTVTEESGEPVPFANILLINPSDSSLIKGSITDVNGAFRMEAKPGTYQIVYRMVGFKELVINNYKMEAGQIYRLGAKVLEPNTTTMEEVVIEAKKPLFEQQLDKLVVNVAESITASSGTALDVLERSPGVIVNRQNNSLALGAKDGVIIMINGKRNYAPIDAVVQMLSGMNANNIQKIEIITAPSAKYDAEGDAGIINIVLKDNPDLGTNGSFSVSVGYGKAEKSGATINFNHRKKRINLFGNYSWFRDHNISELSNSREVNSQGEEVAISSVSDRDAIFTTHGYQLGLDYELSDKTVVGGLVSGLARFWDLDAVTTSNQNSTMIPDENILIGIKENNDWSHIMGNVNVQHTFKEDNVLTAELNYLYYNLDNPSSYVNDYLDVQGEISNTDEVRITKLTPINIWVGQIDYRSRVNEKLSLEMGLKYNPNNFINDVVVQDLEQGGWVTDPELTGKFELNEDIYATYISANINPSERFEMKLGMRYEYTDTQMDSETEIGVIDREFGNFFPTVFIGQKVGKHGKFQASYNRRISRPTFQQMAPFVLFLDPQTFFAGNIGLRPAITDAIKLDYSHKSMIFTVQYSYDDNPIARFQPSVDEENNQIFSAQNMDWRETWSLTMSLPASISDWFDMQNSVTAFHQTSSADFLGSEQEFSVTAFRLNTSMTFTLPKDWTYELSGFYSSPQQFGISEFQARGSVNMGIQKQFKDDSRLRLAIQDIFWTNKWRIETQVLDENLNIYSSYFFEPRIVTLSYTRNFGNSKLRGSRKLDKSAEELRRRATN